MASRDILVCEATRVEVPPAIEGCACQVKFLGIWARFPSAKVSSESLQYFTTSVDERWKIELDFNSYLRTSSPPRSE